MIGESLGEITERGLESEVVQRGRTEFEGKPANAFQGLACHLLETLGEIVNSDIVRCLQRAQAEQLGKEHLGRVIVKFTSDPTSFVFLCPDNL